jgi:hypothetical protein
MAVTIATVPVFRAGTPERLFNSDMFPASSPSFFRYDVTSDGRRFLVNSVDQRSSSNPITVVLNWNERK